MLIDYCVKVVGIPLSLTRVEVPSWVVRHCLQYLVVKSWAQRNIYTRVTLLMRHSQGKYFIFETYLTCGSFKLSCWANVLSKESKLVTRTSFDISKFRDISVSRTCIKSCTVLYIKHNTHNHTWFPWYILFYC